MTDALIRCEPVVVRQPRYGMRQFFVYVLSSYSRRLYVGVTNNLERRIWQHRTGAHGFTARYHIYRLVHYESTENVIAAIAREKQIKGWGRAKKFSLIETTNPFWIDLADTWFR